MVRHAYREDKAGLIPRSADWPLGPCTSSMTMQCDDSSRTLGAAPLATISNPAESVMDRILDRHIAVHTRCPVDALVAQIKEQKKVITDLKGES